MGVENHKGMVLNVNCDLGGPGARTVTLRTGSKVMLLAADGSLLKAIAICFQNCNVLKVIIMNERNG